MSVVAEALVALLALGLAVDGARKLRHADAFVHWLVNGDLRRVARRPAVVVLGAAEVLLGVGCVWPAGRVAAIAAIVAVTPLGAILVRRTGVCACRGVLRSQTPRELVVRNALVVAVLAASLLLAGEPVPPWVVLAVAAAWAAVLGYRLLVLWRAPVQYAAVEPVPRLVVGATA